MLRFRYRLRHRNLPKASGVTELGHGKGPEGRILRLRKIVTALVRHERIEGAFDYMDESRGYVELLIQEAQKHGDKHAKTMELADYWLLEKDLVHKLFKVLAPRYQNYSSAFTKLHHLPKEYPGGSKKFAILELKGNPWPPVVPHHHEIGGSLVNVLVDALRQSRRAEKFAASTPGSPTVDQDDIVSQARDEHSSASTRPPPELEPKKTPSPNVPTDGTPV